MWIKTPVGADEQEIWIYNLENNTLSVLDDHNDINFFFYSPEGIPTIPVTWDNFDEDLPRGMIFDFDTWNDFPDVAGGAQYTNRMLSVGGRKIFIHDQGETFNGRAINAVLRREDLTLSGDTYSSSQINRMILWVSATTPGSMISARVGGSNAVNGALSWTGSRTLAVDTGEKLDFRKTVRWGSVEFTSMTPRQRLSGYELETTPSKGRR